MYCPAIWRPHLLKDIALLDTVQKRATKWIVEDYTSNYKTRLKTLQILLMMVYELNDLAFFLKALQSPSHSFDILDHVSLCSCSLTHSNGTKLTQHSCHGDKHSHFYFNCLPQLWITLSHPNTNLAHPQVLLLFITTFKQHFISHFDSSNTRSYRFKCPCHNWYSNYEVVLS